MPHPPRDIGRAWTSVHRRLQSDPVAAADRAASRRALRAWMAAREHGESPEKAHEAALKACGRRSLRFDHSERFDAIKREERATVRATVLPRTATPVQPRPRSSLGTNRPGARTRSAASSSTSSADPGDPAQSSPATAGVEVGT